MGIKSATRDDVLAAHRVPPQLIGLPAGKVGGFGDMEKAARVFVRNEMLPLQTRFLRINEWIGDKVVRFLPYSLDTEGVVRWAVSRHAKCIARQLTLIGLRYGA